MSEEDALVLDGDDGDFTIHDFIELNNPSDGNAVEYTAKLSKPNTPVTMQKTDVIEIQQFTYQKQEGTDDEHNWIVMKWTVKNIGDESRHVKLAFFLDADAGGEVSNNDEAGYYETVDPPRKIVYLKNATTNIHIGMALVPEPSLFDGYQIINTSDARMPTNELVGAYRLTEINTPSNPASGDDARRFLFEGHNRNTLVAGPEDLAMTLISDLHLIQPDRSITVTYAIAVSSNLDNLSNMIDEAIVFAEGQ